MCKWGKKNIPCEWFLQNEYTAIKEEKHTFQLVNKNHYFLSQYRWGLGVCGEFILRRLNWDTKLMPLLMQNFADTQICNLCSINPSERVNTAKELSEALWVGSGWLHTHQQAFKCPPEGTGVQLRWRQVWLNVGWGSALSQIHWCIIHRLNRLHV